MNFVMCILFTRLITMSQVKSVLIHLRTLFLSYQLRPIANPLDGFCLIAALVLTLFMIAKCHHPPPPVPEIPLSLFQKSLFLVTITN